MLPLAGLRVLSVEQYGAGPFGTTYLADLGAEVIKIENPGEGGELGRRVGPFFLGPGDSHFYQCFNRNKRSVRLDLKSPGGQEVLRDLAASCEAVFGNLRGDQPEALGLTYRHLGERNPAIVCVHLSAYGRTGERGAWPGFDFLMQAEAGHLQLTGSPDGPPERYGISVVDYMTGLTAAFALIAGVLEAWASGVGRDFDVSLLDVARYNLGYHAAWYLNEGYVPARLPRSAHASMVPCQLYTTSRRLDLPHVQQGEVLGGARCGGGTAGVGDTIRGSRRSRPAWRTAISSPGCSTRCSRSTTPLPGSTGSRGRFPPAPVNAVGAALDEARADGRVIAVDHPEREGFEMMANPILAEGATHPARPAPALGAGLRGGPRRARLRRRPHRTPSRRESHLRSCSFNRCRIRGEIR